MYLIAIGYAYVVFLVALASGSLGAGLSIALFLGVLPLWAFIRLASRRSRRASAMAAHPGVGQVAGDPDRGDPQADQ